MAAVQAGKNVFMEKPCCVDAGGYRLLLEANRLADAKGLKVGVGLQRHHHPGYQEVIQRIHDGAIGKIGLLRAYWDMGNIWYRPRQPGQTEMQFQVNNWYHFTWLSGDHICEQHVHNLDVCNWVMNGHPVEANGMGGCTQRYAGEHRGMGQIFDHHFVEFTYPDGTKMYSQCRQISGTMQSVSEAAHGSEGSTDCAATIFDKQGAVKYQFVDPTAEAKVVPEKGKKRRRLSKLDMMPYNQEHVDLVKAIRANQKYNEGHYGADSSFTAVLGRMATYSGQVVRWDDAVKYGAGDMPETLSWDATPPVLPDKNGDYPIALPGMYKPYVVTGEAPSPRKHAVKKA
jgi:predicted dehydrogenase